jgi:hypothetical protein
MAWKCIKIIYIFIFLNLFLISAHQDDPKHLKNNLKLKKNLIFFKRWLKRGITLVFPRRKPWFQTFYVCDCTSSNLFLKLIILFVIFHCSNKWVQQDWLKWTCFDHSVCTSSISLFSRSCNNLSWGFYFEKFFNLRSNNIDILMENVIINTKNCLMSMGVSAMKSRTTISNNLWVSLMRVW